MTDALFDVPPPEPLRLPRDAGVEQGAVSYQPYQAKYPGRCDDCVRVLYEANRAGASAPPARQARWKRTVDNRRSTLLCAEHKHLREVTRD